MPTDTPEPPDEPTVVDLVKTDIAEDTIREELFTKRMEMVKRLKDAEEVRLKGLKREDLLTEVRDAQVNAIVRQ